MEGLLIVVGVIGGIIALIVVGAVALAVLAMLGGVILALFGLALMLQPSVGGQVVGAILFLIGLIWSWLAYEHWKNN